MRLIDADAMYKRYCVDAIGLDGIYDTTDLPDMLGEMPTIDAIPVEWLLEKMNIAEDAGDLDSMDLISWLIQTWQNEQEVR